MRLGWLSDGLVIFGLALVGAGVFLLWGLPVMLLVVGVILMAVGLASVAVRR